jgi:hypothetical protein
MTDMNSQTARGLEQVIQEAKIMSAAPFTKREQADAIIRRGLSYLIREISATGHTFGILTFAHEVSRPDLLADPVKGVAEMERLGNVTPNDVPMAYWAFASDVFYEAGRHMGLIPDPEDVVVKPTCDGTVTTYIETAA